VKQTFFGKVTPTADQVLLKTLMVQNGAKIGYESGASLLNKLGLTTLIPRDIEITTNRYGTKLPESCHIKLRKPPLVVTDENWKYLQFIDIFAYLPEAHTDAENPKRLLLQYTSNGLEHFNFAAFGRERMKQNGVISTPYGMIRMICSEQKLTQQDGSNEGIQFY
jgi:hypothetical protein